MADAVGEEVEGGLAEHVVLARGRGDRPVAVGHGGVERRDVLLAAVVQGQPLLEVVEDELVEDGRVGVGRDRRQGRDLDGEDGEQEDDQGVPGPMLPPGLGEEPAADQDDEEQRQQQHEEVEEEGRDDVRERKLYTKLKQLVAVPGFQIAGLKPEEGSLLLPS